MPGGSSQNTQTTQQSSTAPGALGMPTLNGILAQLNPQIANSGLNPTESNAIAGITNAASGPNPYAPAIAANANTLLAGGGATNQAGAVNQNYQNYQAVLNPLASNTNYDPMQTPGFANNLAQIGTDVTNQVNGAFAAAGRDGSGMNQQTLARGIAAGEAPVIAQQYNANVANQQGAAANLYGAGNTNAALLTGMQQQGLANSQTGTQAATDAWNAAIQPYVQQLQAGQLNQSIPAQNLGLLAQIGIPIASMSTNSTGSGTSNTTSNPSFLQDLQSLTGSFSNLVSPFTGGKKSGS